MSEFKRKLVTINKYTFVFAVLASFLLVLFPVTGKAEGDAKQVLVLQSYHRGHEWTDKQGNAIFAALGKTRMDVTTFLEYMDWKRYPNAENLEQLYSRLKFKYMDKRIDLIMTTDDAALQFALEHREELFSNAPIVFSGVLKRNADVLLNGKRNVTGIYEEADPEGTIEAAKQMIPNLSEVYVIHDKSESGRSVGGILENAKQVKNQELKLIDLSNNSIDQILEKVASLASNSIVILSAYNTDINGLTLSNKELARRISDKSAVPVFTIDEALLGAGSIGGSLTSGDLQGKMTAGLGIEILNGAKADSLAIINIKSVFWGFDYIKLKQYGIPISRLPHNSQIINQPFSFFETYKIFIILSASIFVFLIGCISILLINIKSRKKTEVQLKEQKEKIFDLAYYNSVTRLPNRAMLNETVNSLLYDDRSIQQAFHLVYLDLDNFKEVNDSFGHMVGDRVLYSLGQRLREIEAINGKVFNLGGDEFILLLTNIGNQESMELFMRTLFESLAKPFLIERNAFYITISGGIVYSPEHGNNFNELLKNADTAMYKSREVGKGIYTFFDKAMGEAAVEKTRMQSNLRKAIENKEFLVFYQPQLDSKSGEISGFEALIRWNSPELGMVSPLSFIKIAEDSRLIVPIGEWVLETACQFIKKLHEQFCCACAPTVSISVNISVIQLLQDDFVDTVLRILQKVDLPPQFLELEITESIFLNSNNNTIDKLEKLKAAGIIIALDDFGTGYSSLSYLSQLPISTLKIDKAFIDSIFESRKYRSLTSTIITMGHVMGMQLVAEGVETKKQQSFLTKLKCDRIQGYIVSRPMPESDIIDFLRQYEQRVILSPS